MSSIWKTRASQIGRIVYFRIAFSYEITIWPGCSNSQNLDSKIEDAVRDKSIKIAVIYVVRNQLLEVDFIMIVLW